MDSIEGLSPAISIDQKTTSKNPRSTVGTVTEIYDYLRLLYARIGIPHCPVCGREIKQQSVDEIVDRILALEEGTRIQLLAPIVRGKKGQHLKALETAKKSGYVRVRIDGNQYDLSEQITLEKNKKHTIEIIVDRLVVKPTIRPRLTDRGISSCRRDWRRRNAVLTKLCLSGTWRFRRRTDSSYVLFQQSIRSVSALYRFGRISGN